MAYFLNHSDPEQNHVPRFSSDTPLLTDDDSMNEDAFMHLHDVLSPESSEERERRLDHLRVSAGIGNVLLTIFGVFVLFLLIFMLYQLWQFVANDLQETFPLLKQHLGGMS